MIGTTDFTDYTDLKQKIPKNLRLSSCKFVAKKRGKKGTDENSHYGLNLHICLIILS